VPNTGKAVLKKKLPEFAMDVPGLKVEIGRLRPMGESLDNGTGDWHGNRHAGIFILWKS
jgi:hypothetical protein